MARERRKPAGKERKGEREGSENPAAASSRFARGEREEDGRECRGGVKRGMEDYTFLAVLLNEILIQPLFTE